MFEERFMLCFEVVCEFSNVEIYVFVFFVYVYSKLGLFSACDDGLNYVFSLAAPSAHQY